MKNFALALVLVASTGCKGKDNATSAARPSEPARPTAPARGAIKLADLPDGWTRSDGPDGAAKLEYVAAVNETKFPVDNAVFSFDLGVVDDAAAPTDPAAYGEWQAGEMKDKVLKTEKLGDAVYFEFRGNHFQIVTTGGSKLLRCGGSLYRDKDYDQIPKIRDAALAQAKQLCATMRL